MALSGNYFEHQLNTTIHIEASVPTTPIDNTHHTSCRQHSRGVPNPTHSTQTPTTHYPKMQRLRPLLRMPFLLSRTSQTRTYQKLPFNRAGGPQYKRFTNARGGLASLFTRWVARPTFYRDVGVLTAGTGTVYVLNLEEVPVSGRRRFNVVSARLEASLAASTVAEIQQQYAGRILDDRDARVRLVRRVLDRLVPFAQGVGEDTRWEVTVIESAELNAFVVPGGKVFVFTGILEACRDEDGVAAVLGHEIAHVVAHHTAYVGLSFALVPPPFTLALN